MTRARVTTLLEAEKHALHTASFMWRDIHSCFAGSRKKCKDKWRAISIRLEELLNKFACGHVLCRGMHPRCPTCIGFCVKKANVLPQGCFEIHHAQAAGLSVACPHPTACLQMEGAPEHGENVYYFKSLKASSRSSSHKTAAGKNQS